MKETERIKYKIYDKFYIKEGNSKYIEYFS